jgi:hypothetical protein
MVSRSPTNKHTHTRVCAHAHTHTRAHTLIRMRARAHTHTHTHTHRYTRACTHIHTHSHTRITHTLIHTYTHARIAHTFTHMHTNTHTLAHAYHTRMYCTHLHTHTHANTHPHSLTAVILPSRLFLVFATHAHAFESLYIFRPQQCPVVTLASVVYGRLEGRDSSPFSGMRQCTCFPRQGRSNLILYSLTGEVHVRVSLSL